MVRWLLAPLIFCLLTGIALATPLSRPAPPAGEQCRAGIAAAERGHGIPAQLLSAIGRVESGKRDPDTGAWGAWPWTINAEGQGSYFDSKADAIKAVQALQMRGVRSIDVGCMQVNLMHHPMAFPSLDMAFEPAVNADYAARFLNQLHDQTGDWSKATANYHSSNPPEGEPYAAKVLAIWPEEQRRAGLTPPLPTAMGLMAPFARAMPARQPPRMFAMAGMIPGKMPTGMIQGAPVAAGGGQTRLAPPGMLQGGSIPVGTLPSGSGISGMVQTRPASGGQTFGQAQNAGRGLEFYRAAPIGMAMPIRLALFRSKVTMR